MINSGLQNLQRLHHQGPKNTLTQSEYEKVWSAASSQKSLAYLKLCVLQIKTEVFGHEDGKKMVAVKREGKVTEVGGTTWSKPKFRML